MNITEEVDKVFPIVQDLDVQDKINSFFLEYYSEPTADLPDKLELLIDQIQDDFIFSIKIEQNDSVQISPSNPIENFISEYETQIQYFEEGESLKVSLTIFKSENYIKNIYNFNSFSRFIESINSIDLLNTFSEILINCERINFIYLEDNKETFNSNRISFGYKVNNNPILDFKISENCHFTNYSIYQFSFHDFYCGIGDRQNVIRDKINILSTLFSIVSIFDITSIEESSLIYKLNGNKLLKGKIAIDTNILQCSKIYYQICEWIYSDKSNITEKIELARNVLTLYISDDISKVDGRSIISMKSAYKTYLKNNVEKYIDIRSKIFEDLEWISQKSSEVIRDYLSNFHRSIFAFITFFLSIFVIQVFDSEKYLGIFNKDATILSFGLLILSILYLIISRANISSEKDRISRTYSNIKARYRDLLIEEDISIILNNDEEFNYEMDFIKSKVSLYTFLWVTTVILLVLCIISISNFFNWESIGKILFFIWEYIYRKYL